MSSDFLTQQEADTLIGMPKIPLNNENVTIPLPHIGGACRIGLSSQDKGEVFTIAYTQNTINLIKRNHHCMGRKTIGLVRLDVQGPPHQNPDKTVIGPNHLHIS